MAEEKKDLELLEKARDNFNTSQEYFSENYELGKNDQEFVHGINQWDPKDKAARDADGRPSLVLNQMLPYCNQVINDIRQARPAVRVTPVDGGADIETAKVMTGLIRNVERQSKANDAYDTAAMNAVTAGLGWIRVCLDYANPYTFDQEIRIERVLNFRSAYLDPSSVAMDGSDAEFCFIFDDVQKERFEAENPKVAYDGCGALDGQWVSDDTVRVVEYYYKTYESVKIYKVTHKKVTPRGTETYTGAVTQEELDILDEQEIKYDVLGERETEICKVKQCTFVGTEILSETDWPSKYLPLIPVYGQEVFIEDKRHFRSLIEQGKDAQRMYNYWKSASTEFIALQPKTPWVGPLGSFKSNPTNWADANRKNIAFLEYDIVHDANGTPLPPPTRTPPIQGSPAMFQEAESARGDIRLALGMGLSNMGQADNAISGVAIRNRQIEGDNATFHFMDNLASSITQVGCICVDLIPRVYSEPQVARIIGEDGVEETVPLNQPYKKGEKGKEPTTDRDNDGTYDMAIGKYDVVCDVGPSYSSQRQETADKMQQVMANKPELFGVIGDLFFKSLDVPMAQEIAERIKATMDPAILGDDPQAAKLQAAAQQMQQMQEQLKTLDAALQSKQQDTQFEQGYKLQELQIKRDELALQAQKTQAEVVKMNSEAVENKADAKKALAEAMEAIAGLQGDVSAVVEAIEIILDDSEANGQVSGPESDNTTTTIDVTVED